MTFFYCKQESYNYFKEHFIIPSVLKVWFRVIIGVIKLRKLHRVFPSMAGKEESCVLSSMHLNVSLALNCLRVWHGHRCLT